jgi:hypothetical protein
MKAMTIVSWAALALTSCNAAKAAGPSILSPLGGDQDNALISEIQSRNPGSLCSLVTSDGLARLMSFGQQAVVDFDGKPSVLSYHRGPDRNHASFDGAGIRVSGALTRQDVKNIGKTASHHVSVDVEASGRSEHLSAEWTCQKALLSVAAGH